MPKTIQELCHETVDTFIDMGVLQPYERSGRFRAPKVRNPVLQPEQWEILHYADCAGPLYASDTDWDFAFRLVNSFSRRGQRGKSLECDFPRLFGEIPGTGAADLLDELPVAFSRIGFQTQQKSPVTRSAIFLAAGQVKMNKLPEPFGKYWQIKKGTPRWNEDMQLEVLADVRLHETPTPAVVLDLTLSTAALPVVGALAAALGRQLGMVLTAPEPLELWRQISAGIAARGSGQGGRGGPAPPKAPPPRVKPAARTRTF